MLLAGQWRHHILIITKFQHFPYVQNLQILYSLQHILYGRKRKKGKQKYILIFEELGNRVPPQQSPLTVDKTHQWESFIHSFSTTSMLSFNLIKNHKKTKQIAQGLIVERVWCVRDFPLLCVEHVKWLLLLLLSLFLIPYHIWCLGAQAHHRRLFL